MGERSRAVVEVATAVAPVLDDSSPGNPVCVLTTDEIRGDLTRWLVRAVGSMSQW